MTTAGLLIIEPVLYIVTGAGTVPGTPFKVSHTPFRSASCSHTTHHTHPAE
jgi:hypothetical protein